MTDDLDDLLRDLPRRGPSQELRRATRVAALDALARRPTWRDWLRQLTPPVALAAASLVYLVWAAEHTPLLR